jgi:hypothetical protein
VVDRGDLADVIQSLADHRSITEVIHRYFFGADQRDYELLLSCYHADARLVVDGVLVADSRAALRRRYAAGPPRVIGGEGPVLGTTHVAGQISVDEDGDTARTVTLATAYLVVGGDQDRRLIVRGLRYSDRLVRLDDGWKIVDRLLALDWMYEVTPSVAKSFDERSERRPGCPDLG